MPARRTVLGSLVGLLALGSGCLGENESCDEDGDWSPHVAANEVTLSPGEEDTLRIEADGVAGLKFLAVHPPSNVEFDLGSASVSPNPDVQADSYPPIWYWSGCTTVTVVVPVRALADATAGEHEYGVRVYAEDRSKTVEKRYSVTVVED